MLKPKMGLVAGNKKIGLLFLLISASLLSTSLAGRVKLNHPQDCKSANKALDDIHKDEEDMGRVHERVLRANTKDYGTYDPTPALVKPPFKLIPN